MNALVRWLVVGLAASRGWIVAGAPAPAADESASAGVWSAPTSTSMSAAPTDEIAGTEADFSQSSMFEPAPVATLTPVAPPGVNMAGTGVLTPDVENQHFYNGSQAESTNGTVEGTVTIQLNVTYDHPSVTLDHSIFIIDVECENGTQLRGRFNLTGAYAYAESSWPVLLASGGSLVLVTSAPTCGTHEDQNAFFLADTLEFDDPNLAFVARGQERALQELMQGMKVAVGGAAIHMPGPASNDTIGLQENGTSTSTQSACGSPAASTLDGLPAVACGAGFDAALNARLGYYSANDTNIRRVFGRAASGGGPSVALMRRDFWDDLGDFFDDVGEIIHEAADAIVDAVEKAAEFIANAVESIAEAVVAIAVAAYKLAEFIVTGEYNEKWKLNLTLMPGSDSMVESPWGDAVKVLSYKSGEDGEEDSEKIKENKELLMAVAERLLGEPDPEPGVTVYCIECGIHGSADISVHLSVHPLDGIGEGTVHLSGNLYAGLYLGINAFAKVEKKITKEIISRGLPGWSIPGIISIGPKLSLSAEAGVEVTAEGQIFAGASLTWPDIEANLDLSGRTKSTSSGWEPQFDRKLNVHGEVSAKAHIGLPIKLFFGVDIFEGAFELGAALVDMPAIVAEAKFEAEMDVLNNNPTIGSDECEGVELSVSLTNELSFELDPGGSWTIAEWPGPTLASVCLGNERKDDDEEQDDEPAEPEPTSGPDVESTVTCPDHDGRIFRDINGNRLHISCSKSTSSSAWHIGFKVTYTFTDCVKWCAEDSRCAGVTWLPPSTISFGIPGFGFSFGLPININNIWGTNEYGIPFNCAMDNNRPPSAMLSEGYWSATPVTYQDTVEATVNCPANDNSVYADHRGLSWRIHCYGSIPMYDGASVQTPVRSLEECMDFCALDKDCSGAVWNPIAGTCQTGHNNPGYEPAGTSHALELMNPHGIISVMYGKLDVTQYVSPRWATGDRLVIDTTGLNAWAPAEKMNVYDDDDNLSVLSFPHRPIFMLYTYGGTMKSWVGGDWMGTVTIYPPYHPDVATVPGIAYVPGTPSTSLTFTTDPKTLARPDDVTWIRIVEVCYGLGQQRLPGHWYLLYNSARGNALTVHEGLAGGDFYWNSWPNAPNNKRWMVVWFKDTRKGEDGPLYAAVARDGEAIRLMYADGSLHNKREDIDAASSGKSFSWASNDTIFNSSSSFITASPTSLSISTSSPSIKLSASATTSITAGATLTFGTAMIQDISGALALYPGLNGNLLVAAASGINTANLTLLTGNASLTAVSLPGDGTTTNATRPSLFIGGDSADRVLHYFPAELVALGASRLRLATRDKLPQGSRLAGLVPAPKHGGILLAFDASAPAAAISRKPLYLVLCEIADQVNRVFVVQNATADAIAAALLAPGREFVVTGGKASNCGPLPLVASLEQAGPGSAPPGWLTDL